MRHNFIVTAAAIMILLPVLVSGQQGTSFVVNNQTLNVAAFNEEVKKMMDDVGVPGLSLAIIDNNQVVFYNTYGVKELGRKEPVNKKTIFEAASLSKPFLVFVVFKLVDEGKLDLDKPMYQYMEYEPLKHDPRYKLITPRMILNHTSGVENWRWMNNSDTLEILSNPGEKFVYSGEAYNYLAKVIELLVGASTEKYMEEFVFKPLKLKRTFSLYKHGGRFPRNYATGHLALGNEVKKWKNDEPVPSSAINTTAGDYARLMVAFFGNNYLSRNRINDVLRPGVKMGVVDSTTYATYGEGFEVQYTPNDTIVWHGGDNVGFKAIVCYSVVHKRGLVMLTNGDRGKVLNKRLNEMTVGLNLLPAYGAEYRESYPGYVEGLLKTFREKGADAMMSRITAIEKESGKKIPDVTLTELGLIFLDDHKDIARRILEEDIKRYPGSFAPYDLLGLLNMEQSKFEAAYRDFSEVKKLRSPLLTAEIDVRMKRCIRLMNGRNNAGL